MSLSQLRQFTRLFITAHYVAKRNHSFAEYPQFLRLQDKNEESGTAFEHIFHHHSEKTCKVFIKAMSQHQLSVERKQIEEAKFLIVQSDGSMSLARRDYEIIYIRYFDKEDGKPVYRYLSLEHFTSDLSARGNIVKVLGALAQLTPILENGSVKEIVIDNLETLEPELDSLMKKVSNLNTDTTACMGSEREGLHGYFIRQNSGLIWTECVNNLLELAVNDARKQNNYLDVPDEIMQLSCIIITLENEEKFLKNLLRNFIFRIKSGNLVACLQFIG